MAASRSRALTTTVQLSADTTPGYTHVDGLTETSAKKVSDLLTANHALFHTRWKATFHNHMVHHLLALWALGASPDEIQDIWDYNETYQTPRKTDDAEASPLQNLKDPSIFERCLGDNNRYADFLSFFEDEVTEKGVPTTIKEYLLKGDDRANTILCRMFSDLEHPMIHLGCGLEFQQPSIVAEALAGACVHESWPAKFLLPTEDYVRSHKGVPSRVFLDVLQSMRNDPVIVSGVKHTDPFNKIADGLLTRVGPEQLAPHLAQLQVGPDPEDLQRKTVDVMYSCAYMIGAAQQPGKREALDFVTLHAATMCVFLPVFLEQDWLSLGDKARLLEAKARVDAVMYAGTGCPALYPKRIRGYVSPRRPGDGWPELFRRAIVYRDEGHAVKLMRALYCTEQLGEPAPGFPISRGDLINIGRMAMDSIEMAFDGTDGHKLPESTAESVMQRVGPGGEMVVNNMTRWVFYGGLENAWNHVPSIGESRS
ncbi:hypothetical protein C8A03DRAFT_17655 [Achaetomium macrosporum]|uniref:Oxidoreductase AflY n=1 Tax=Achaetomium macrosporum TaxID=79813 RepID=A0AAN7C571_9PEZI|nr:hypothetical protein C8A03DRAFT_17655 [Achaetomium macrosporum]